MSLLKNSELAVLKEIQTIMQEFPLNESQQEAYQRLTGLIADCEASKAAHNKKSGEFLAKYRQTDKGKEINREQAKKYGAKYKAKQKAIKSLAEEIVAAQHPEDSKNAELISLTIASLKSDPGALASTLTGYPDLIAKIESL